MSGAESVATCPRCQRVLTPPSGSEGRRRYRKLCIHCRLSDVAQELLDDGTGAVPAALQPLIPILTGGFTTDPIARWRWLHVLRNRDLLDSLATGQLELSHAALDALPDTPQRIAHLRAMLVDAGCLPTVDDALHRFETWLHRRLVELAGHRHERALRQFGVWHHLAKMRTKATQQPLTENARTYAVLEVNRAVDFCTWLAQHSIALDQLTQPDLDRYYRSLTQAHQQSLRGFLNWAMATRRMPALRFTPPRFRVGEALTQQRRLELLRDLLTGTDQPLASRVAGCILLLFALPIPRILALELEDVIHTDGEVQLRLGTPPTPVPEPFAALVRELIEGRTTAGGD
jgi:hypothetical protein